jgi:hypothetical protein
MGDNGKLLVGEKGFILSNNNNLVFPAACAKAAEEVSRSIPRSPVTTRSGSPRVKAVKKPGRTLIGRGRWRSRFLLGMSPCAFSCETEI